MTITLFIQAALVVAGLSVAGFCHLLARRLRKLNDLETGLGGAIAVMAAEQAGATHASDGLAREIEKAKSERAYWALQQQFMPPAAQSRRLRRRRATEVADA